jgi:hypothetical protein
MRIFTTIVPVVLWVNISRGIEKCLLRIKESVMDTIDKPITKPHSFLIIRRFNLRYNSNSVGTNMQQI